MNRYHSLFSALEEIRKKKQHLTFMEIGTYDGVRASQLLNTWKGGGEGHTATYYGFDLFELCTAEISKAELSKSKLPPRESEVKNRLKATGAEIHLFKGFTKDTLPPFVAKVICHPDLIFLDGGHSLETVASDWQAVAKVMTRDTIVLLDDYYENRGDFGCRRTVDALPFEQYDVKLLDPVDHFDHTNLDIRMARVVLK